MQVDFAVFFLNKTQLSFPLNLKPFPSIITVQNNTILKHSHGVSLKTDDNGRVGNVLCAYSSLMVTFLNES